MRFRGAAETAVEKICRQARTSKITGMNASKVAGEILVRGLGIMGILGLGGSVTTAWSATAPEIKIVNDNNTEPAAHVLKKRLQR